MKRRMNRVLSVVLALAMVAGLATVSALAMEDLNEQTESVGVADNMLEESGKCGENITWSYDPDMNILVIDGTGDMYDYSYTNSPFYANDSIQNITVGHGVTSIGKNAFRSCESLMGIEISDSVTSIGEVAFFGCSGLQRFSVNENNEKYSSDDSGVLYNKDMTCLIQYPAGKESSTFEIPDSVTQIGPRAFYGCVNIKIITNFDNVTTVESNAFYGCTALEEISSKNCIKWENVDIGFGNDEFKNAQKKFSLHSASQLISMREPSCTEDGYSTYKCKNCSETYYDNYTEALGHNFGDWMLNIATPGTEKRTCSRCGATETREAHEHIYTKTVTSPTCTKQGYTTHVCLSCGYTYTDNYENALGHDYDGGICKRCGLAEGEKTESAHPYSDNLNYTCTVSRPNAKLIALRFSEETETEEDCDFIHIYDTNDNEIGFFSGKGLSGKTVYVIGNKATIRLVTYTSFKHYGFSIEKVEAYSDFAPIEVGQKQIEIVNPGEYFIAGFVPDTNGTIQFYSTGNADAYVYIFDENMNAPEENDDGEDGKFSITAKLRKGQTYYLACRFLDEGKTGTINLMVEFEQCEDNEIVPVGDAKVIIDKETGLIYGFPTTLDDANDILNVLEVDGDASLAVTPTENGYGTGTIVDLVKDGEVVESYSIVVFGDATGDGIIDESDFLMIDLYNAMLYFPEENCPEFQGMDCTRDGVVDESDIVIVDLVNAYMGEIDQLNGGIIYF